MAISVVILVLGIMVSGCASTQPATTPASTAQPIELKFSYWPPPADKWVQRGILPWGPELEQKTNGKVKVTYFGGATLAAPPDHLDLVMKGTADIGWINPAFTPSVFPLTDIRNMPFLYPSVQVAAKVFWRQQEEILNDLEYKNKVKVLWTFPTPVMECSTRTKQIKTLEDLKGLKFGDTEPLAAKTSTAMGAVPVILQETEIYTGLERGMLDGRWQEYNGLVTWKCGEVTKYRTDNVRIFVHQNIIGMNIEKYNSLPADIRKAIDDLTGYNRSAAAGDIWAQCEVESKQEILAYDKKVGNPEPYVLPDAERARFVAAAQPVVDEWLKEMDAKGLGSKAKNLYDKTKQWVQEYSK
jgi:TRAP-type C4-dicarboxylate transport system substrate-binding protein